MTERLIGQTLDHYRLDSLLGSGVSGAVFKAHDLKSQRDVALKVIKPQLTQSPDRQIAFAEQAGRFTQLDHPGIVKVVDFGQANAIFYLVMELLSGDNLLQMLRELRLAKRWIELKDAIPLARQVSLVRHYARQHDIAYQDVRPNNIMFKYERSGERESRAGLPYQAVLTDLSLDPSQTLALHDPFPPALLPYLSPEQVLVGLEQSGQPTDSPSDVYALGVLLHVLALQNPPATFKTLSEAIDFHQTQTLPAPRSIRPDLPPAVADTISRAVAKDPADRFPDAAAFAEALVQLLPDTAPPQPAAQLAAQSEPERVVAASAEAEGEAEAPVQLEPSEPSEPATIFIQTPEGAVRTISIQAIQEQQIIIGRASDNQIVLDFPDISRRHAQVVFDGQTCQVIDLGSTNRSYLDQLELAPHEATLWKPGQTLRIGDRRLR